MKQHILQAQHNEAFHDNIVANFNDQFFDWRITVLFYVAIHYLQALAAMRGIHIGDTHYDIELSVNPDRNNNKMAISKAAWREYKNLFNYPRTAHYEGITDFATFERLKETDYNFCLRHLDKFKKYIQGQGLPI